MGDYTRLADLLLTNDLDTALRLLDRRNRFNTEFTFNVVSGGVAVGSVSDAQTMGDGNEYNLPELNATPGITLEVNFTGVTDIYGITACHRYVGSSVHYVDISIYNYTTAALVPIRRLESTTNNTVMTIIFPKSRDFFDSSGNAQIVYNHPSAGNTSHDLYIDYIALIS